MRKICNLVLLLSISGLAFAQEVMEKTIPYSGQKLDLDMDFGDEAIIKSWDKNEIYIKVTYEINEGKLNDALKLDIDDDKDRLSIDVDLDKRKLRNSKYYGCDRNRRGRNQSYYNGDGYSMCADISLEIFLPKSSDIWVNTVVADVEVEGMEGDVEIETVTGLIDVTWSKDSGADIKMKTVTGAVYTNMDFDKRSDRGLKLISSHDIRGTYKSGGKEVNLETVTSDIRLRKSGE